MARVMWLWSANPTALASTARSSSPLPKRSSAARTRRRSRYCEIVLSVITRDTRLRWNGDAADKAGELLHRDGAGGVVEHLDRVADEAAPARLGGPARSRARRRGGTARRRRRRAGAHSPRRRRRRHREASRRSMRWHRSIAGVTTNGPAEGGVSQQRAEQIRLDLDHRELLGCPGEVGDGYLAVALAKASRVRVNDALDAVGEAAIGATPHQHKGVGVVGETTLSRWYGSAWYRTVVRVTPSPVPQRRGLGTLHIGRRVCQRPLAVPIRVTDSRSDVQAESRSSTKVQASRSCCVHAREPSGPRTASRVGLAAMLEAGTALPAAATASDDAGPRRASCAVVEREDSAAASRSEATEGGSECASV